MVDADADGEMVTRSAMRVAGLASMSRVDVSLSVMSMVMMVLMYDVVWMLFGESETEIGKISDAGFGKHEFNGRGS